MTFLEKLDLLMEEQGINRHKLSQLSEVPYTTIAGFYSKGYENAKISTVRKLASALGCTLDYLIEDEPKTAEQPAGNDGLSQVELDFFNEFRALPASHKGLAASLCTALVRELVKHQKVEIVAEVSVPAASSR